MVKFGKNKLKILNKLNKKQNTSVNNASNKVLKKKINAGKKVSFQKEVFYKEAAAGASPLVKTVIAKKMFQDELIKKSNKPKVKIENSMEKPKVKAVEKHKKRQKTQISDTKLLLNLMKKK